MSAGQAIVPVPRISVSIRQATMADLPWIDSLQKLHNKMLGFMSFAQLRGYIEGGHVLIAADDLGQPLGYIIAKDRYFKRDDVGVIFQLNVSPGAHRKLVGASLVQAAFERAAYGCRLFCCWCAQDIDANYFWESIGFVPLAFRTGGRGRGARAGSPCHQHGSPRHQHGSPCHRGARIHIFWQRRVREGDSDTPYWYPSQTNAGAIAEDRLVFPIPPGTHWSDAKPIILPSCRSSQSAGAEEGRPLVCDSSPGRGRKRVKQAAEPPLSRKGLWFASATTTQGLRFPEPVSAIEAKPAEDRGLPSSRARAEGEARATKPKQKNDPRHVAMARELRDRYLEEINAGGGRLLPSSDMKYDVSRQFEAAPTKLNPTVPLLEAA